MPSEGNPERSGCWVAGKQSAATQDLKGPLRAGLCLDGVRKAASDRLAAAWPEAHAHWKLEAAQVAGHVHHLADEEQPGPVGASMVSEDSSRVSTPPSVTGLGVAERAVGRDGPARQGLGDGGVQLLAVELVGGLFQPRWSQRPGRSAGRRSVRKLASRPCCAPAPQPGTHAFAVEEIHRPGCRRHRHRSRGPARTKPPITGPDRPCG